MGDILLGHRFSFAIKEKYPNSEITAFIDSEGKTFQKECLTLLFPSFYKEIFVIPNKKYKKLVINSQFGTEEYRGGIENTPDEWMGKMKDVFDLFYNLHIDSLEFLKYDFDWFRYFRFFPKPELEPLKNKKDYVVFHLMSSTNNFVHRLENFYINKLVCDTAKFIKVKILSTEDINHFYKDVKDNPNVEILNENLDTVLKTIGGAKFMVSVDSGFKYVGYCYSIPTICLGKDIAGPMQPYPSHVLRWMPFPETCFPLNFDAVFIVNLIKNTLINKANILMPQVQNFDNQVIRRNYTVDYEKSILSNYLS